MDCTRGRTPTRYLNGARLIVLKSRVDDGATIEAPGTVIDASGDAIQVAPDSGERLALIELQPEGRRAMAARDFLAGHTHSGGRTVHRPMTAPARTAAFHALVAIGADRADLPSALAHSRSRLADERDRALTAAIVTGTLRWQRTLDHLIEHFAQRPLAKLDPNVARRFSASASSSFCTSIASRPQPSWTMR